MVVVLVLLAPPFTCSNIIDVLLGDFNDLTFFVVSDEGLKEGLSSLIPNLSVSCLRFSELSKCFTRHVQSSSDPLLRPVYTDDSLCDGTVILLFYRLCILQCSDESFALSRRRDIVLPCSCSVHTTCTIRSQFCGFAFASLRDLTSVLIERSFPSYWSDSNQLRTSRLSFLSILGSIL